MIEEKRFKLVDTKTGKEYEFDGLIWISIFYSFTLYSPLISIFHYNSIFFSWLIIYVIYKTQ